MFSERCLSCRWHRPDQTPECGRVFEAEVFIWPLGGKVSIGLTPGLVPREMESEVEQMLTMIFERVAEAINRWPGWLKIADCADISGGCPGREEKSFAKEVKFQLRRIK